MLCVVSKVIYVISNSPLLPSAYLVATSGCFILPISLVLVPRRTICISVRLYRLHVKIHTYLHHQTATTHQWCL